ncbi:RagB/SusD family nutrient uptake outer membrane protein [Flavivirga spongiicola]|uniref:RagB/SusD family nutrient uptake outer membrane protein n=1 Tax=Flavivirga spongiicola TaxID=421621 RepID=A0ABU7XWH5_9FLAO|nr:RagB/SusD family nutrient uptake outer membrane protein [Flavivirga sp. MEBiC05379]MDO5979785.1 RagB/SusD family nutrient uptake outer membrane protein [Flavivirga sp. MEBiC05379]
MKKNNIKILGLFAMIALILSCEKELDLAPLDQVSDASFWKSASDFEKAANAFYFSLRSAANGTYDQNSDITVGHSRNGTSAGQLLLDDGPGWGGAYGSIRAATRITENYELAEAIQSETKRYAAEARFFRAQTYHNLVRTFGGVPLIRTVLTLDSEELDAPRASREEVVAYILEDIDWAIANLPLESELASNEKGRVTQGAALALKSRMFLYEGTWAKYHATGADANSYFTHSINASQALIDSGEYEIYMGGSTDAAYRHLFIEEGEGSKESILARRYNEEREIFHNTSRWVSTNHNSPTKMLADMYVCTDGLPISISPLFQGYDTMASEFQNRDPRMSQTMIIPGSVVLNLGDDISIPNIGGSSGSTRSGYLPYKFFSDNEESQLGRCYYDYMVIRYAEVLLNHAEALYEKNGSISDSELDLTINQLRDRVGLTHLTNGLATGNALNMLWQIRNERTVELAYEGFRYDDLRRWKESENFLPVNLLGVKYDGTDFPVDGNGFIIADDEGSRSWDQKLYLYPIPVEQIKLNPNLTQNPGW